jgi:hypothetical protein
MIKKLLFSTAIASFLLAMPCRAQVILNGDFETNTLTQCSYNMQNSVFTGSVANAYAFGSGNEIDMQDNSCAFGAPASGSWFASISSSSTGNIDAFSLGLSAPLIAGNQYVVSFYNKANTDFTYIDSLLIGISSDSMSFGSQMFITQPIVGSWSMSTFSFTPSSNMKFITVTNKGDTTGWNFIDNFVITDVTGIGEYYGNGSLNLYPNPAGTSVMVSAQYMSRVAVYSADGRLVLEENVIGKENHRVELGSFAPGIYIIEVRNEGGQVERKKLIKQ